MGSSGKNKRSIPSGKSQANFNIDNALLEKVKDLAHIEGISNSEIYNRGIKKLIELYEKRNGKIKPRPVGKGFDDL